MFKEKELSEWCVDVANQCDVYAKESNLDFYVFQSDYPTENVDLLILGINPGGSESYAKALENKRIERGKPSITKRDETMLAQGVNIYAVDGAGNDVMREKLKRVFTTDFLQEKLQRSTVANIYYFNTRDVKALGQLAQPVKRYCEKQTRELIRILHPEHLLFFCTSYDGGLRQIGVKHVKSLSCFVKVGELEGRKVLLVPNPGFFKAYSKENGFKMGQLIERYLKNEDLSVSDLKEISAAEIKNRPVKMDLELLLNALEEAFMCCNLSRYDQKRFRILPCELQLTVTKQEIGIRHLAFEGQRKYDEFAYPKTDQIRDVLATYGFRTDSNVWLGTKPLKGYGKNIHEVSSRLLAEIKSLLKDLEILAND